MTNDIIKEFPLIVNTIVPLTAEEELELHMLYGKSVVLDINPPEGSDVTPYKSGYVFRVVRVQLAKGLNYINIITSCTDDIENSYAFFQMKNYMTFSSYKMQAVDLDTDTQKIVEHNDTWKLTPHDDGYYDLNFGFEHLKRRLVNVSKERYLELGKTYGHNFFIMDVDFGHYKVDEGYLFWKHYSNNSLFVTSLPKLQNGMIYFGPRSYGKVAPFCGDFTLENVWSGDQSSDFNTFWRLKPGDKGYKRDGAFDEYNELANTLNGNNKLIPSGFYRSITRNDILWRSERQLTSSDIDFIEKILNRNRDSSFHLVSPNDRIMITSIFPEESKIKVYVEFENENHTDSESSFTTVKELCAYLRKTIIN